MSFGFTDLPIETIDALSDKLADDYWNNWAAIRSATATELGITEDEVEEIKEEHYRHIVNQVFYYVQRGGHVSH